MPVEKPRNLAALRGAGLRNGKTGVIIDIGSLSPGEIVPVGENVYGISRLQQYNGSGDVCASFGDDAVSHTYENPDYFRKYLDPDSDYVSFVNEVAEVAAGKSKFAGRSKFYDTGLRDFLEEWTREIRNCN